MKDLSIVADWTTFADFDGFKKLYSHGPIVDCIVRKRRGVEVDALCWWVELVTSEGVFCKENMRRLCIPAFGSPARIAMHSLGKGCEGLPIRLELYRGYLAINGLIWDNRIVHIKDIAA